MWEEQTGESGRPSSHAKCKGNMTLLQLPNGDITICSATSLQISKHFGECFGLQDGMGLKNLSVWVSLNTIEFEIRFWPAHLLFISFVLVLHVGVINVQRGGKKQFTTGCEKLFEELFLITQRVPITQNVCLISLTMFPIKAVVQHFGKKAFIFQEWQDSWVLIWS